MSTNSEMDTWGKLPLVLHVLYLNKSKKQNQEKGSTKVKLICQCCSVTHKYFSVSWL